LECKDAKLLEGSKALNGSQLVLCAVELGEIRQGLQVLKLLKLVVTDVKDGEIRQGS